MTPIESAYRNEVRDIQKRTIKIEEVLRKELDDRFPCVHRCKIFHDEEHRSYGSSRGEYFDVCKIIYDTEPKQFRYYYSDLDVLECALCEHRVPPQDKQ